jgi:hypothetical protein
MRKGDTVKFNKDHPKIQREIEFIEWADVGCKQEERTLRTWRPSTDTERNEWRERRREAIAAAIELGEDTFHIAFDCAGESRLPPRTTQVAMPLDGEFIVERARCRVSLGYSNPEPGMARILNPETGEHSFVKRELLEVVQ